MKGPLLIAVMAVAAAGIFAPTVSAAPGVQFGIKDDAWLLYGPGTLGARLAELDGRGVDIVRFTLRWDDVASRQPASGRNPRDPAYRWEAADRVLGGLRAHGIAAVVTLVSTPAWANGGLSSNWVPLNGALFADFAYAAARRYPFVRYWTIWNEPNQRLWLRPTSPRVYVETLLNPAYAAIKQASSRALVGGGVTAPRGNFGGVSPLAWIAGMAKAGAKLDAYAHHPYPLLPKAETPWSGGCGHCESVTMATLERLISAVRRELGPTRIWLTEYGYQTSPPDPWLGVSWALQARYVAEAGFRAWKAPYVDMLINFMYWDDVPDDVRPGWQSGFYSASGVAKPSLRAFVLPFAQVSRIGAQTTVWGQVRPRSGRQTYRVQELRNGGWEWVGGNRLTGATGTYLREVTAKPGSRLRVWSPRDRLYSPVLTVR